MAKHDSPLMTVCTVCNLGLIPFDKTMLYEQALLRLRHNQLVEDMLLFLEHPPTVTLGKNGNPKNVLLSLEELTKRGIAFFQSDRGGDATFNCPGQLIIHPIINLGRIRPSDYVSKMEEIALRVVKCFNVPAERIEHPGVYVNRKQIAAIGLKIRSSVSIHGLSLNVNPDLSLFNVIHLCGIEDCMATSIAQELGFMITIAEVIPKVEQQFSNIFGFKLKRITPQQLEQLCFSS